ncbi:hypothetical protein Tco_0178213 [Tanacetum coccineum]
MAVLESCPKHNMVAYLEKSEGNAEFHEVIDFFARSSIHHALTIGVSEYLTPQNPQYDKTERERRELAIPEKTATGKGIPNPLMAGSLPKTIQPTELDVAMLLKRQVTDEDG